MHLKKDDKAGKNFVISLKEYFNCEVAPMGNKIISKY